MDYVRKFDGFLDEEDGNVVSNDIPIALLGVKLEGKTTYITYGVCRPPGSQNSGEPNKHRSHPTSVIENRCVGQLWNWCMELEATVSTGSPRMHDTLGYPLVVNY